MRSVLGARGGTIGIDLNAGLLNNLQCIERVLAHAEHQPHPRTKGPLARRSRQLEGVVDLLQQGGSTPFPAQTDLPRVDREFREPAFHCGHGGVGWCVGWGDRACDEVGVVG